MIYGPRAWSAIKQNRERALYKDIIVDTLLGEGGKMSVTK